MIATCAYEAFLDMKGMTWKRPIYRQDEIDVPLIDERDLDMIISVAHKKLAAFLHCLKETFADPGEIINCEWTDLNGTVLSINHPVKGHNAGKNELSGKLVGMLNSLPRRKKRIFASNYYTLSISMRTTREKAAKLYGNPALLKLTFKSFREWGGTKVAYESHGNILVIMRALRHKSFKSSLRYINALHFNDEDFDTVVATSAEEILALGKEGWQKYDEATFNSVTIHFYRKPKRFGSKIGDNKVKIGEDKYLLLSKTIVRTETERID
jgi:integrase